MDAIKLRGLSSFQANELRYVVETYEGIAQTHVAATVAAIPADELAAVAWGVGSQLDIARDNRDRGRINSLSSLRRKLLAAGATERMFTHTDIPPATVDVPTMSPTRDGIENDGYVARCTRCGRGLPRGAYAEDHSQCWIDGQYVGECEYVTLPTTHAPDVSPVDHDDTDDAPTPDDMPSAVTFRSFVVELHADYDTDPRDLDCYDDDQLAAWDRGEWRYVGMVPIVSFVVGDCQVSVTGSSLWGVEYGDMPGVDSGMGETSYLVYAARENLYDVHEWLASVGVDIDTLEPYIVERF